MKLTDSKKTIEIELLKWKDGSGYEYEWSMDFFDAGLLPYDEETNTFTVVDVDYCIEQANEWKDEDENNIVSIEFLQ